MPKIDKYRGKEKDELSKLSLSEALPLMTSRARRALRSRGDTAPLSRSRSRAVNSSAWCGVSSRK